MLGHIKYERETEYFYFFLFRKEFWPFQVVADTCGQIIKDDRRPEQLPDTQKGGLFNVLNFNLAFQMSESQFNPPALQIEPDQVEPIVKFFIQQGGYQHSGTELVGSYCADKSDLEFCSHKMPVLRIVQ